MHTYISGTISSGFILLLNKKEQFRRQVLQGMNVYWHFHEMDNTFCGFAENFVNRELQRLVKNPAGNTMMLGFVVRTRLEITA